MVQKAEGAAQEINTEDNQASSGTKRSYAQEMAVRRKKISSTAKEKAVTKNDSDQDI